MIVERVLRSIMPGVVEEHPGFVEAIVSSQAVCSCGWMQQGTAKHPKAHATPLGVWMSLLEEKSIFLHKSFELGTSKPCGCSQKCVPVQCPLAVAVLHRGNVLGRAAPTGISAEFSNELRINLFVPEKVLAQLLPWGGLVLLVPGIGRRQIQHWELLFACPAVKL